MIDLHSHLIPGVDDGAGDLAESRAAIETLVEQDVHTLVTTPHLGGAVTRRPDRLADYFRGVDEAWDRLHALAAVSFPHLRIERGTEVMLDIPEPNLSDSRVRLAGTDFVLVEFPYHEIPPHSIEAIYRIRLAGCVPVIAHPERYRMLKRSIPLVEEWKRVGGLLQVNCGSLLGRYGGSAQRLSTDLLRLGLVDYLASDYHARGRCAVAECRARLLSNGGEDQAHLLLSGNPSRLLNGEAPEPVPPLNLSAGLWTRLRRIWM